MSVKKYRKKPFVVEAMQLTAGNLNAVAEWCGADIGYTFGARTPNVLDIHTPEGAMPAYIGDFIIKGVHGEFYLCKPNFFAATYEEVME